MPDSKKLVFLENKADAFSFIDHYSGQSRLSDAVLYAFDSEAAVLLREQGLSYRVPEETIPISDYDGIDHDAIRFAREWHRDKAVENHLLFEGVSLGSLIQRDMSFFISVVLDAIITSRQIIHYEKPREVYYFRRDLDKAARAVKAGKDETYYGYFTPYFIKNAIELGSSAVEEECGTCSEAVFIDHDRRSAAGRKNILLVEDLSYLDASSALSDVLRARYNIKYLNKNKGAARYGISPQGGAAQFAYSSLKDFFQYQGIDFFRIMQYKFDYLKQAAFPFLIAFLRTLRALLDKEDIHCVIVNEDAMLFNRAVVSAAKSMGIATVVLQKGICCHDISFVPVTADKIAVWGHAAEDYLLKRKIDKEKIVITGSIRFQGYGNKAKVAKDKALEGLSIKNEYGRLFVAALQHGNRDTCFRNIHLTFYERLKIVELLYKVMSRLPADLLCIKFHPKDELNDNIMRFLSVDAPRNIVVVKDRPIERLLTAADALITCFSTTALEALLMDVPVIIINVLNRPFNIDFVREKVAMGACGQEDLFAALSGIKSSDMPYAESINDFLGYHFFRQNNNASENIGMLIDSIIDR